MGLRTALAIGGVILFVAGMIWLDKAQTDQQPTKPTQPVPAGILPPDPNRPPPTYKERFCDPREITFSGDYYSINIAAGCFAGPITLPRDWGVYNIDKSENPGDWVVAWCIGKSKPSRPFTGEIDDDAYFNNCAKLYLQGKGSVRFTKLTTK